jgi:O-antigen ligase
MLKYLLESKSPLFWVMFHIILGGLCILSPWFVIGWFYFVLISSLPGILKRTEDHFLKFTGLIVYIISFELLGRISRASPFIPYEIGKYLLLLFLLSGIIIGYRKGSAGWVMLILLIPGMIIDESGQVGFKNIVANLFGPISVALAVIFFKDQVVYEVDVKSLLRVLALPLISVLAFVIIKTPDFEDVEFVLSANQETSGGWGSNQVSTALGLGAFLTFLFLRHRWILSGFKWLDLIIFLLFALRGLLTFSRGGMIGGALGIMVLLFYEALASEYKFTVNRFFVNLLKVFPLLFLLTLLFQYADRITEGNLVLRYKGETPGTAGGHKEKTLNIITANRLNVFKDDLQLWGEHPLLGVGVGASFHLREKTRRVAAHVEMSRLLSEHGLLGLIYFTILLVVGFKIFRRASTEKYGPILLAIFLLALFTTFHSAMRTFITPLLIGLSLLIVTEHPEEETAG